MDEKVMIEVKDAAVRFNLSSEKIDNLKEYFVKLVKRELMFQEFFALDGVDLTVRRGESWGIIGKNGSGKSTLLKLISGILKPYRGSVKTYGSIAPLIELQAGFDGRLTARENVFLNGAILGHSREFMLEHFDEIIDFAEVRRFVDVPVKNFSSGMSARLGFALATMVQPEILIVDEVLAVGDKAFMLSIFPFSPRSHRPRHRLEMAQPRGPENPLSSGERRVRRGNVMGPACAAYRGACAPIGGELSITAGEPKANLRKGSTL